MRAVIFAGGKITDYSFAKSMLREDDLIIAADSGLEHFIKIGIEPDVTIGDMDSVQSKIIGKEIIKLEVMKDETDTEAAAMLAVKKGADNILLLGVLGTRQDHSIANVLLLKKLHDMNVSASIVDEHNEIHFFCGKIELSGKKGDTVSVLPLSNLEGVVTEGLFYALSGETLVFGESRGVSNVMTDEKCVITATSGTALIIKSRD
ncbi:MAG: thiamine diphosphokinase [Clostridia bacterium]|nr:thiamine diphosphokinase [Clostridia bacterium]